MQWGTRHCWRSFGNAHLWRPNCLILETIPCNSGIMWTPEFQTSLGFVSSSNVSQIIFVLLHFFFSFSLQSIFFSSHFVCGVFWQMVSPVGGALLNNFIILPFPNHSLSYVSLSLLFVERRKNNVPFFSVGLPIGLDNFLNRTFCHCYRWERGKPRGHCKGKQLDPLDATVLH